MTKRIFPIFEIAYFPANITLFQDQLSNPLNAEGVVQLNLLISEIARAINTQTSIITVTIVGCSDRVDIAGLNAVEKNKREYEASAARAKSAEAYISMQLTSMFNLTQDQIDSSQHYGRTTIGVGSSQLSYNLQNLTDIQRDANRRVCLNAFIFDL